MVEGGGDFGRACGPYKQILNMPVEHGAHSAPVRIVMHKIHNLGLIFLECAKSEYPVFIAFCNRAAYRHIPCRIIKIFLGAVKEFEKILSGFDFGRISIVEQLKACNECRRVSPA